MADRLARRRRAIARRVGALGLRLRPATLADLPALLRLQERCFAPPPERRLNAYELWRIVRFGGPLVAVAADGEVVAYDLAAIHDGGAGRVVASAGFAVHPRAAGRHLGSLVVAAATLDAAAAGAVARHGVVHPANTPSLILLLHHLGAVCDGFVRRFGDWGEPRLTHRTDLAGVGRGVNRVDEERLAAYVAGGGEHLLIDASDEAALAELSGNSWGIAAVAREPIRLVAVPVEGLE